jgi:hypothetical protein
MRTFILLLLLLYKLSVPSGLWSQELKHRPNGSPRTQERCIEVRVWREKGVMHYQYMTGQTAKGDLNYELGEEKLSKGRDCRVDVILDETTIVADLKEVPKMAIDAGYWDIHVYILWNRTGNMAEVTLVPRPDDTDEIVYGPVQRFSKKHAPV